MAPNVRRRKKRGQRALRSSSVRLGVVLAVLVGINIYVFFVRGGTSLTDVRKAAQAASIVPNDDSAITTPPTALGEAPTLADPDPSWAAEREVVTGDSLGRILKQGGLAAAEADQVIRALEPLFDFRSLRPGQTYRFARTAEGRFAGFELRTSPTLVHRVEPDEQGQMHAQRVRSDTERRVIEVSGEVKSSLWEAVTKTGESGELVMLLADLFAYDLNFYIETHEGDRFKFTVEKHYANNEFATYGRVLAARYTGRAGDFQAFWWDGNAQVPGGYYDADGRNIARVMLKTPLKFAHVSSQFNPKRMHPVLHRIKGHWGTDYAAPVGTPIWASATGRVAFVGPRGGAGNAVILNHGGGLATTYMHMSRFAAGLKTGQTVKQKQVIGYVGQTGLTTGPHLHFAVTKNGQHIDPMRMSPPRLAPIPKPFLAEYRAAIAPARAELAKL